MIELNEQTKFILGRPNFWCAQFTPRLRKLGHDIPNNAEEEQAHVIHWMLCLYEEHGSEWKDAAENYLKQEADQ